MAEFNFKMRTKIKTIEPPQEMEESRVRRPRSIKRGAGFFSKIKSRAILIPLVIIIILGLIYFFKNQLVVAIVNGQPISRFALIGELDKRFGKKTLDAIVTKTIILQEAKKQNASVSKEEIDKEVKDLEDNVTKQGQNLNQLLESQGMTREDLREQIRIQKLLEKIAGKDISITDQEVNDYIEKNKDLFPKEAKMEDIKEKVKEQLKQEKLNEKTQTFLKQLRDNAKINYL